MTALPTEVIGRHRPSDTSFGTEIKVRGNGGGVKYIYLREIGRAHV